MIYLTVMGRCGNQMFQYAFARRMAEIQKDQITINFGELQSFSVDDSSGFCDELSHFCAVSNYKKIETKEDLVRKFGSKKQRAVYRIYKLLRKFYGRLGINPKRANSQFRFLLSSVGIFTDTTFRKKKFELDRIGEENIFIKGYFEEPDYFQPIKELLYKDFVPLNSVSERNALMLERIQAENSICVSFRKWDVRGREICGEEYYRRAFEYFNKTIANPTFVIFSNDVDWVKRNFALPDHCIFESGENPVWEKVLLMSSCQHFIITNSTFAWWIQYLGKNKNKIVVAPSKWFESQKQADPLFLKEFIEV